MACPGSESTQAQVAGEVSVPFGWQRNVKDGQVCYVSPSGIQLSSIEAVETYLTADDTCKCGLECPLHIGEVFIFDGGRETASDARKDGGEVPVSSSSCRHIVKHRTEGMQRKFIQKQGAQTASTAAALHRGAVLHQGGGLPVQMRPSLQRSDVLMQNSIEAQQHQIQLKIREASFRQAHVLSSDSQSAASLAPGEMPPSGALSDNSSSVDVKQQPTKSSGMTTSDTGQKQVDLQTYSASFNLLMNMPPSSTSMLHQMLDQRQQHQQQQQASMLQHTGCHEINPPPSKRQRSKSLEEQQWYYSMMRSSAPVSPIGANVVPGVSSFCQSGLPLMNIYGQPSANLVSFRPSYSMAEYPMLFSRGVGSMPTMMRHVTPVSLISQFPGAQLGIPCYGSTIPLVQRTSSVPFGMVPQPVPQRALVRLPSVSTSAAGKTPNSPSPPSMPGSVIAGSHIVLQAPKTVKDMLAENRWQGKVEAAATAANAGTDDKKPSSLTNSLGNEHEAVRNEVAETLCSLSSGGEVLFDSSGSDIPSEPKEVSDEVVDNTEKGNAIEDDDGLGCQQNSGKAEVEVGNIEVTPEVTQSETQTIAHGFTEKNNELVEPLESSEIVPTVDQDLSTKCDQSASSVKAESGSYTGDALKQIKPSTELQEPQSEQPSHEECKDETIPDTETIDGVCAAVASSPLKVITMPSTTSVSKEDASPNQVTSSCTSTRDLDDTSTLQREPSSSPCSDPEQTGKKASGSTVHCGLPLPSGFDEDGRSAKETKIAAVETLLQLSTQETLYSVPETGDDHHEEENIGAKPNITLTPSAEVINDATNVHEPTEQLCDKTEVCEDSSLDCSEVSASCSVSSVVCQGEQLSDQIPSTEHICESGGNSYIDDAVSAQTHVTEIGLCQDSISQGENVPERNSSTDAQVDDCPELGNKSNIFKPGKVLDECTVIQDVPKSETKDSREAVARDDGECGGHCVATNETFNARDLNQATDVRSEINNRGGDALEEECENLMCNEKNVCENNSSMVDSVKDRTQSPSGKQSLGNHASGIPKEDKIVRERELNTCPKGNEIAEMEKEKQISNGVSTKEMVTSETSDEECLKEKDAIQHGDGDRTEVEETDASKSTFLPDQEEPTLTKESNMSSQPQDITSDMSTENSDKENVEDCESVCTMREMSPVLADRNQQQEDEEEEEHNCSSQPQDNKSTCFNPNSDKHSIAPSDSVLSNSTLININKEQEKQSHKEVESSNLLSSLDLASPKSQASIVTTYGEDSVSTVKPDGAAEMDPKVMEGREDVFLVDVPSRRGSKKDDLMSSFLKRAVTDSRLMDQDQSFTSVGRMTRRRRPDPVLAVETNRDVPSRALRRHFETGDLVWGQTRGHTSWPGKLVSDGDVKGQKRKEHGKVWVMWFGDHSYAQVEPDKLKTLSEGLEAHHNARTRVSRYMNMARRVTTNLEAAIQEAMLELDKQTEQVKSTKRSIPTRTRQVKRQKNR